MFAMRRAEGVSVYDEERQWAGGDLTDDLFLVEGDKLHLLEPHFVGLAVRDGRAAFGEAFQPVEQPEH